MVPTHICHVLTLPPCALCWPYSHLPCTGPYPHRSRPGPLCPGPAYHLLPTYHALCPPLTVLPIPAHALFSLPIVRTTNSRPEAWLNNQASSPQSYHHVQTKKESWALYLLLFCCYDKMPDNRRGSSAPGDAPRHVWEGLWQGPEAHQSHHICSHLAENRKWHWALTPQLPTSSTTSPNC